MATRLFSFYFWKWGQFSEFHPTAAHTGETCTVSGSRSFRTCTVATGRNPLSPRWPIVTRLPFGWFSVCRKDYPPWTMLLTPYPSFPRRASRAKELQEAYKTHCSPNSSLRSPSCVAHRRNVSQTPRRRTEESVEEAGKEEKRKKDVPSPPSHCNRER
ncbi:hypothetical protein AAMO2058_001747600 [Amorphochlora amoebiformis]